MEVFEYSWYPEKKTTEEIDIEEFLTSINASGIYLGNPNGGIFRTKLCAVNYGTYVDREPIRGIQDGKKRLGD